MQGRLTTKHGRSIQFFPFDNWQREFEDAASIGIDEIEFIFDFYNYKSNPLWTANGVREINNLISKYKVSINTICADYFMISPFFRTTKEIQNNNISILETIIKQAGLIGAKRIEIPFLDNSSIKTEEEEIIAINVLKITMSLAKEKNISINIEADLVPKKLKSFIDKFGKDSIGITYDSGNSSGLGYDPKEEIKTYGKHISNVHIKDRVLGGTTMPLGTGDTRFDDLFEGLNKINYKGSFILQVAREKDGEEKGTIKKQKEFIIGYINKYLNK